MIEKKIISLIIWWKCKRENCPPCRGVPHWSLPPPNWLWDLSPPRLLTPEENAPAAKLILTQYHRSKNKNRFVTYQSLSLLTLHLQCSFFYSSDTVVVGGTHLPEVEVYVWGPYIHGLNNIWKQQKKKKSVGLGGGFWWSQAFDSSIFIPNR